MAVVEILENFVKAKTPEIIAASKREFYARASLQCLGLDARVHAGIRVNT